MNELFYEEFRRISRKFIVLRHVNLLNYCYNLNHARIILYTNFYFFYKSFYAQPIFI